MKDWKTEAEAEIVRIKANAEKWSDRPEQLIQYLLGVVERQIRLTADINAQLSEAIARNAELLLDAPPELADGKRFVSSGKMVIDGVEHETRVYRGPATIVVR